MVMSDERSAKALKKIDTHMLSPVYDKEAKYFHVPITAEFEFEYSLKKEKTSFHSLFSFRQGELVEISERHRT
jgi:hypothetical protein